MSDETAAKNAMRIPSRGSEATSGSGGGRGQGRGREDRGDVDDDDEATGLSLGDNKDGKKLAEKLGVENMNKLIEGFEELSSRVLPSPLEDGFLDALDTNFKIEFEPEYLMGEFDQNPDIDEKPPMPVRKVLEKIKPFMMAYEGIQSHEEGEEAVEDIMTNLLLLEETVDHYSGPDRVTAKKQEEELERVAKTIPARAPVSVKRFDDRSVLSLQVGTMIAPVAKWTVRETALRSLMNVGGRHVYREWHHERLMDSLGPTYLTKQDFMYWLYRSPPVREKEIISHCTQHGIYVMDIDTDTMLVHPVMTVLYDDGVKVPKRGDWAKGSFDGALWKDGFAGAASLLRQR